MEHAQRALTLRGNLYEGRSLNPYFNGTCSKSCSRSQMMPSCSLVLILILMEHAQRDGIPQALSSKQLAVVLILILMEHAQRDRVQRLGYI